MRDVLVYLVFGVALVVDHGPHPGDALLSLSSPEQGVAVADVTVTVVMAPQKHTEHAGTRAVHVIGEQQTLGAVGTPQLSGQQPGGMSRQHVGGLNVHVVPLKTGTDRGC